MGRVWLGEATLAHIERANLLIENHCDLEIQQTTYHHIQRLYENHLITARLHKLSQPYMIGIPSAGFCHMSRIF